MKTKQKSPGATRLGRVKLDYIEGEGDAVCPLAWIRAHAIADELFTVCEHSIDDRDWGPKTKFLQHVVMPRLFAAYRHAVSIHISFEVLGKKKPRTLVAFDFREDGKESIFMLSFTVEAWGHIARVINEP